MTDQNCRHKTLLLLNSKSNKLRCRHCHLTIDENELVNGYCPECYDIDRVKRCDFEVLDSVDGSDSQYRCERCGILITG